MSSGWGTPTLWLRPLWADDEAAFVAAHQVVAGDRFTFGLGYQAGMPWPDYLALQKARRRGEQLPGRWVPTTSFVADVDGTIVGRVSIRHELNDFPAPRGWPPRLWRAAGTPASRVRHRDPAPGRDRRACRRRHSRAGHVR